MCDPVSLTLFAASAGIGAAGSIYSGMTAAQSYGDQAAFADRQATLEGQAGAYERERLKTRNTRILGGMRQQYVSAGIDPSSGSAAAVIEDSAREAALDEEAVLFGAKIRSENKRFEARTGRANAQSAIVGSIFNAASSIVGAGSSAFDMNSRRTMITNGYT